MIISCSLLDKKTVPLVVLKSLSSSPQNGMCMTMSTRWLTVVVMQLGIINAFCSERRQSQFNILAEKASTSYDNRNVRDGDMIPCVPSLRKHCYYFQSMQACSSTLRLIDHRGQLHHLLCTKGAQQGDGCKTVRFDVTIHPSIGRVFQHHPACKGASICDDIFVVTPF